MPLNVSQCFSSLLKHSIISGYYCNLRWSYFLFSIFMSLAIYSCGHVFAIYIRFALVPIFFSHRFRRSERRTSPNIFRSRSVEYESGYLVLLLFALLMYFSNKYALPGSRIELTINKQLRNTVVEMFC